MNYYEILGININANNTEIKVAYRREAMKWHPDRHQGIQEKIDATRKFKLIAEAYRTLIDPNLRAAYDADKHSKTNQRFNENTNTTDNNQQETDADKIFNEQILDLAFDLASQGFSIEKIYDTLTSLGCPNTIAKAAASFAFKKHSPHNQSKKESNINQDEEFYLALIGEKRQNYYLNYFTEFEKRPHVIQVTWNWWAAFFNVFWMFYRKMWLVGFLYLIFSYITMLIVALSISTITESFEKAVTLASGIILLPFFALTGLFANWHYYRHCKTIIKKINKKNIKYIDKIKILAKKGGTSNIVYYFLLFIFIAGIFAEIALSAYQDYTNKIKNQVIHQQQSNSSKANTSAPSRFDQDNNEAYRTEYLRELKIIEARHPELNPESPKYLQENEDWVRKKFDIYVSQNHTPINALKLAISDYEAALR